ncbi:bile acid:sodium symporter, partial [Arthrobacter sp. HMWF013]|uniref:bile acid:sodium symporter n=1 Tax=Arthrobacter sp. HMWF013 TaxID=2056849 RepID=UPI000D4E5390
ADATAIMFCGSEKSLATGLPLSAILFHGPLSGVVILPVIMYHAMQLLVCAGVARRLARLQSRTFTSGPVPARV